MVAPQMRLDRRQAMRLGIGRRLKRDLQAGRVNVTEIDYAPLSTKFGENIGEVLNTRC